MALRAILGFDHVPAGTAVDWRTYNIQGLNWWANNRSTHKIFKDAAGFMQSSYVGGANVYFQITEVPEISPLAKKIFIGFNLMVLAASTVARDSQPCVVLDSLISPDIQPSRETKVILTMQELPGYIAGKQYHMDVCLNIETGVIERWLDDVKLSDAILSDSGPIRTNLLARQFILAPFTLVNGQTNARFGIKDIFINDDVEEEGNPYTGRISKANVVPVEVDTVVGEGWVHSDTASLKEGLTLPVTATQIGVVSPQPPTELQVKLKPVPMADGAKLLGVDLTTSVVNTTTGIISATGSVSADGISKPGLTIQDIVTTFKFGSRLGLFASGPSNLPWTSARLAASTFVLKQD